MQPYVHDYLTPLSFKDDLGDGTARPPGVSQAWVPQADARRLAAYTILGAYRENASRYHLPAKLWQHPDSGTSADAQVAAGRAPAEKYREYGDPALLVALARALLLGREQELVLPDARDLADDASPEDQATATRAAEFQDWLQQWALDERLILRLIEGEENTIGDGDGVYVLGWDLELERPVLEVQDPGWYFPVLTGTQSQRAYPDVVHLAWEETDDRATTWVYRHTYRRRPVVETDRGAEQFSMRLPDGTTQAVWGRRYPWQEPDAPPSRWLCEMNRARWDTSRLKGDTVYDLSPEAAVYETDIAGPIRDRDLGIDFVPVVHVPNDAAGRRHFGRSLLLRVAQLLDDIAFSDTDLQASSELVGNTPVVLRGTTGGSGLDRGPGAEWRVGEGNAALLDTSNALTSGTGYVRHLLDRLSVNVRIAAVLLGWVKPSEVPSGYALSLGFAPTGTLIEQEMRLVRAEKYPLISKFAMRLAQAVGALPDGPTPTAVLELGPYLPEDVAAAVERVKTLLGARAISLRTAVQMLINVGVPIEDAEAEVDRIHSEAFNDAVELLTATDDVAAVREFLGLPAAAAITTTPPTP